MPDTSPAIRPLATIHRSLLLFTALACLTGCEPQSSSPTAPPPRSISHTNHTTGLPEDILDRLGKGKGRYQLSHDGIHRIDTITGRTWLLSADRSWTPVAEAHERPTP